MNVNTFKNYVKVVAMGGKPFFADEIGLSGGDMQSLHRWGMVEPTGKTKKVSVDVGFAFEPLLIDVEAKEWVAVTEIDLASRDWQVYCGSWERKRASQVANELLHNLEALQIIASILD